ncbi:dynein regulatory complex subunit 7-like [Branchiostoma lanceolatum]|uniref:dynein regulatory complex subunit 7-like n=1 Tax=Branchiostoma lanceolatum TaxID=7740 RepID=UPI003453CE30
MDENAENNGEQVNNKAEDTEENEGELSVDDLRAELEKIDIEVPEVEISEVNIQQEDAYAEFPVSYKENTNKEKLILAYAENFRRQYVHLYRDRKPLFLNPVNECGIEKFVSTTIRPTLLPFQELYSYDNCAEFVADYLEFQALDPPVDLPNQLVSPTTALKSQKGNSFDFGTLLCSMLLGAGYDAYCVSGYATREICLMDQTRDVCPLMKKKGELKSEEKKKEMRKYQVKPPKDLRSKFDLKMQARKEAEEEAKAAERRKEEEARISEMEKPKPDALHGLRIHCWVLVLSGKREVPDSFFLEPLTGNTYPTEDDKFLGIESVWNHQNYWVNMQDCSNGCKDLSFDLGDSAKWEYLLHSSEKPSLEIPDVEAELYEGLDDDEEEQEDDKHLEMPPSWVHPILVTPKEYETRCPLGKKTILYKKARLEKFARYLLKDGMITKLSVYDDYELKNLVSVKEWFVNRQDKLELRVHNHRTGLITEYKLQGRLDCMKEHTYKSGSPGPETDRAMVFYDKARVDGLVKREETPTEMTEHFKDRDDFLYYRHVVFSKRMKRFGASTDANHRPILKISERFHRNKEKSASEDVSERVFHIAEDRIQLTFHCEDNRVTASTREFIKPPNANDKSQTINMTPDMTSTFQVDTTKKSPKNLYIYDMLVSLVEAEDQSIQAIRGSEEEIKECLLERIREETVSELSISVYDTERNEKAKQHRKELERQQLEEKLRRQEQELDYLAPFLAQMGDPDKIARQQAFKLKEDCLADLKQRLIDKANLIQSRFEKETQELQKRQQWYQQNQVSMTKEDEEEYLAYCSEAMFRIHILELRLNRHKEMAPHKYMALEQKIRTDGRLSDYF